VERGDTIDTLARWNGRAGSGESHAAPGSAPCTAQLQAAAGGFVAWQGEVANVAVRGDKGSIPGSLEAARQRQRGLDPSGLRANRAFVSHARRLLASYAQSQTLHMPGTEFYRKV